MGVAFDVPTQSIPCDQNRHPSGSTSHHLPSYFSTRKKPVAFSFGPFAQPPYLLRSAGPGLAAMSFSSVRWLFFSSVIEWVLPGQSS